MLLRSDRVRLANPIRKLIIEFGETVQTESVQVISWREGLDAQETRVLKPTGENEVTNQIISSH